MHYKLETTKKFKKSLKRLNAIDLNLLGNVIRRLQNGERLEKRYKDHKLKGNRSGQRDCHIKNDLVLLYEKSDEKLILTALDVGTHSQVGVAD